MRTEIEFMEHIDQLMRANGKLAGQMSAIVAYLDQANIPAVPKITKRVKLMMILYKQMQIENQRLTLLLNEMSDDDENENV